MSFKKEKITELKLQHGENLHLIKLDNGKSAIVRRPTLRELEATQSLLAQGQMMTYNISLFKTCFIDGDKCDDNEYDLIAMSSRMAEITEIATSTVEKL
ncbi:hypothetical protein [Empedobacter sp. GD03739]|uniref:hypothetical protein n=1 Tax=Empedobacter sp. GD03739 TaxID=2975376 RepID=UPI002447A0DB|nr:hypothetical protein [Empedobacter sp. GD03739]MDH1602566.1 hypothetical protein [Empedobacter sp. GD03739]